MGNRIAEIRKEKGLTLRQLGAKVHLGDNTISRYETGKREPKLDTWKELAAALNVSVPYLQGLSDVPGARTVYGDMLKAYRNAYGLTVEQVAQPAGFDASFISDLESGKLSAPNEAVTARLAGAIGQSDNEVLAITAVLDQFSGLSSDKVYSPLAESEWQEIIAGLGHQGTIQQSLEKIGQYVQSHGEAGEALIHALGDLLSGDTADAFRHLVMLLNSQGDEQASELGAIKQVSEVFKARKPE